MASTKRANGGPPPEPAYEDRVIEGLAQQQDDEDAIHVANREGWPRFLRLETRLGTQPVGDRDQSAGFTIAGAVETPNHGALSVDASIAADEKRTAFTLRQRDLPVSGGWRVNNELGVTAPLAPGILRLPSRVYVPSLFTRGASTEWINAAMGAHLLATTGEPGRLEGYPVSGFRSLAGTVTTVAAQGGAADWKVAVRHAHADGITQFNNPVKPSDYVDSDSTHLAIRQESGTHYVQANVVSTRSTETSDTRQGVWVDGEWRDGRSHYGWGLYRLDPDLKWSGQGMASDLEGVYARATWRTRQWSLESSVDLLRPVSGNEDTGVLVTSSGRWRYSRTLSLGAGASVRRHKGDVGTGFADARWRHDQGSTGVRAEIANGIEERSRRLVLDHNWPLSLGWALNTSLTAGRESGPVSNGSIWGAAVAVTAPITSSATLSANASTERYGNGNRASSANVSLTWALSPNWSVEGNFIYSRGRQEARLPIDPLEPLPDPFFSTSDTRSVFLVLRYEAHAGSRAVPLGGAPQGGGGSIEGIVFLDGNRNGAQEAGETGAAGVTIYLDGRYATRTDSRGRFEFPFVAPGTRVVTVLNETLPLPWETGERSESRVEVNVRDAARIQIPVTRRGVD